MSGISFKNDLLEKGYSLTIAIMDSDSDYLSRAF